MTLLRRAALLLVALILPIFLWATTRWTQQVPQREHERANPMAQNPQAAQAGRLLYADHCSKCHGGDAAGKGKRPSLLTKHVQIDASQGDLHWLLVNGDLRRGMPSWSKLPDQQLWQIVSYLKSLKE